MLKESAWIEECPRVTLGPVQQGNRRINVTEKNHCANFLPWSEATVERKFQLALRVKTPPPSSSHSMSSLRQLKKLRQTVSKKQKPNARKVSRNSVPDDSSSDDDILGGLDFSALEDGMAEEEFWARKLGLGNSKSASGRKRLEEEYAKDGLGDDFLELFDFMDEVRDNAAAVHGEESGDGNGTPAVPVDTPSGKYIPPHLRHSVTASEGAVQAKQTRSISLLGLLNRVSEGNVDSISSEIISLLMKHKIKPADIAHALVGIACDNPHITVTLQGTFAAIACAVAVDTAPSNQYSGGLLAALVDRIKQTVGQGESQSRVATNLIRFASILFSLGLFSVDVIDSLIKFVLSLSSSIGVDRKLEWTLTCFRYAGRVMKDHHKSRLSSLLDLVIADLEKTSVESKQVEFALQELKSMKDSRSNFRAIDHLQTACEWLVVRGGSGKPSTPAASSTLNGWRLPKSVEEVQLVTRSDVFGISSVFPKEWTERGNGADIEFAVDSSVDAGIVGETKSVPAPSLEELAAMNRMTTEIKRNAFMAIMGAIDSKHAILRLDQFGVMVIKNVPSIVAVVCHCALQEQTVNKFYLELIENLCVGGRDEKLNRKFSISFKIEFSKLISSGKLSPGEIGVLSHIIAAYITVSDGDVRMEDILGGGSR